MATKKATVKGKGHQKPLKFKKGGEHKSLGVKAGHKISASKKAAARSGKEGKLAKKQEIFRENVLTGRKKK